jgi:Pyridoxamine 5'-phosphate oxidase
MAAWKDMEQAEPEFAARVRRLFDAGRHKTIATLRADGSPRISGIECEFAGGELRFGSMPGARKGADLRRDPRFALHGPVVHPQEGQEAAWPGEAKIAGRAVRAGPAGDEPAGDEPAGDEPAGDEPARDEPARDMGDMFVADISEVVITRLNPEATLLVIESWTPQRGLRMVERD